MSTSEGESTSSGDLEPADADPIAAAELAAAQLRTDRQPRGRPGPRFDRRSPYFIGLTGAAGAATTVVAVLALRSVESILILIGAAFSWHSDSNPWSGGQLPGGSPGGRPLRDCSS